MSEPTPQGIVLSEEPANRFRSRPLLIGVSLTAVVAVLLCVGYYRDIHQPKKEADPTLPGHSGTAPATSGADTGLPEGMVADHKGTAPPAATTGTGTPPPPAAAPPPLPESSWNQTLQAIRDRQQAGTQTQQQLTPAEQARLAAYNAELTAMSTPLKPDLVGAGSPAQTAAIPKQPDTPHLFDPQAALSTLSSQGAVDKSKEKPRSEMSEDPILAVRKPPAGKYMLRAGTWIHFQLSHRVLSQIPGDVEAMIDEAVLDQDGNLLIPQGSVLLGTYNSRLAYGQDRLLQVWSRIVFPDLTSMELNDLTSYGADGASGMKDRTDKHTAELVKNAAIMTIFSAGIALTQRQNTTLLATPSTASVIGQQVGANLGQLMTESTRRSLDLAPTAELRPGSFGNCLLNRDLVFLDGPYNNHSGEQK
jgi:type IV secretion system protein TrbI